MADGTSTHDKPKQLKQTDERLKEKKHKLVKKAIPNIVNAIKTVVSLSKNEDFKEKCFNLVKVKDEDEFSDAITKRLWNIAFTSKLNVKPCDDVGESQTTQKTTPKEVSREDYFDELTGETSFYEDDDCPPDYEVNKTTDASDSDLDSSFELLAELQWNLDDYQVNDATDSCTTCSKSFLASEVQEISQQSSTVTVKKLPSIVEQLERSKLLPVTEVSEVVPDITSPKAKLRCRESTLASTGKTISSNSDWLQEFSQDCFWIANDKSLVKQESETCPKTLKDKVDCYAEQQAAETNVIEYAFQGITEDEDIFLKCTNKSQSLSVSGISKNEVNGKSSNNLGRANPGLCSKQPIAASPSRDTSSQCVASSDDFDALAELSFT